MSNMQPETKQQLEFVSAPEGLTSLRLRLAVGGIATATVVALTELGTTKPARAVHNPEADEILDCIYGYHAVPRVDVNRNGQIEFPDEWACVNRPDCFSLSPSFTPADAEYSIFTPEQRTEILNTRPRVCHGDPEYDFGPWFEAHPWAIPYRATQPTTETIPEPVIEQPETTSTTTPTEPAEPEPEPVIEEPEPEPEADTAATEAPPTEEPTTDATPEPVIEQPETTSTTNPTEVAEPVIEQPEAEPDTAATETTPTEEPTTETIPEPEQPETTSTTNPTEVAEPEATSTKALIEQQPRDIEVDTDTSALPEIMIASAVVAVAIGSIYLLRAKRIKSHSSSTTKNSRRK